jgi:glycine/D-amino acid oxidase-like deaminating enzyme
MYEVAVIGAGVIGVSVARELASCGMSVVLIDKNGPGTGTSRTGFAIEVSRAKTPYDYFALSRRATKLHEIWAARAGGSSWVRRAPLIQLLGNSSEQHRTFYDGRRRRLEEWGLNTEIIPVDELGELGSGLDLSAYRGQDAWVDMASWFDVRQYISANLHMLRNGKVTLRSSTRVEALERGSSGSRWTVVTDSDRIAVNWVVNCAGPDAGAVGTLADVKVPILKIPGMIGNTNSNFTPIGLTSSLLQPHASLRPHTGGHLAIHAHDMDARIPTDADDSYVVPEQDVMDLCANFAELLPCLDPARGGHRQMDVFACIRPVPVDGYPLLGESTSQPGYVVAASHSGITLAPLLGSITAHHIVGRTADSDLVKQFHFERTASPFGMSDDESMAEMVKTYERIRGHDVAAGQQTH